jgi:hypothetical protein
MHIARVMRGFGTALTIALASWAGASACAPTPFTFQEPNGQGGGTAAASSSGEGGGASVVSSSASSGTPCPNGTECGAEVPPGWAGVFIVTGAPFPAGMTPTCPDGSQPLAYFLDPAPSDCYPCDCDLIDALCTTATLQCFMDAACTAPSNWTVENTASTCIDHPMPSTEMSADASCSLVAAPTLVDEGTCSPNATSQIQEEMWGTAIFACLVSATGACPPGEACVPIVDNVDTIACVLQSEGSDVDACPAAYPSEFDVYTDGTDNRSCGSCSCGKVSCDEGFVIYDGDGCMDGSEVPVEIDGTQCVTLVDYFDGSTGSVETFTPEAEVECFGGAAMGGVSTSPPIKLCCK